MWPTGSRIRQAEEDLRAVLAGESSWRQGAFIFTEIDSKLSRLDDHTMKRALTPKKGSRSI